MVESLTRKQKMLKALQDDLAVTKETLKKMKEIEQPDHGFYSNQDQNISTILQSNNLKVPVHHQRSTIPEESRLVADGIVTTERY